MVDSKLIITGYKMEHAKTKVSKLCKIFDDGLGAIRICTQKTIYGSKQGLSVI